MILPSLIVGNELLILAGVAAAVGLWFFAHRHGQLRGLVEAVLHTRILAGLFDAAPVATGHDEGTLFLAPFLELVLGSHFTSALLRCQWEVETEHKTDKGRLDILLRCKEKGILIVIENKTDAGEGDNQLDRYGEWMGKMKAFPHKTLIFLTLDGREAVSARTMPYQRLSYQQILQVLASCAMKVNNSAFKEVLIAYLQVLKGLVPQAGNSTRSSHGLRLIPHEAHADVAWSFHCMGEVKKRFSDFAYVICGADHPRNAGASEYRSKLLAAVSYHGLENHVFFVDRFLDWPELVRTIQACDVGILAYTSPEQSSSGVLALTLACGRPAIATDFQYARAVLDGDNGIVVQTGNLNALVSAIESIAVNDDKRARMAEISYRSTRSWTWSQVAQRHLNILNEVGKNRPIEL